MSIVSPFRIVYAGYVYAVAVHVHRRLVRRKRAVLEAKLTMNGFLLKDGRSSKSGCEMGSVNTARGSLAGSEFSKLHSL
jgi:hypothetical protein